MGVEISGLNPKLFPLEIDEEADPETVLRHRIFFRLKGHLFWMMGRSKRLPAESRIVSYETAAQSFMAGQCKELSHVQNEVAKMVGTAVSGT